MGAFFLRLFTVLHLLIWVHAATYLASLEQYKGDLQQALREVEDQIESINRRQKRNATTTTLTTADPASTSTSTSSTTTTTPRSTTTTLTTTASTPLPVTRSNIHSHRKKPVNNNFHGFFLHNITDNCRRYERPQLIQQLKVYGTYNPDFMAWDVSGVRRFLTKDTVAYDKHEEASRDKYPMFQQNVAALEKMITDLDLKNCDVKSSEMRERLTNITSDLRDYYDYKMTFQAKRKKRDMRYFENDLLVGEAPVPFGISRTEAVTIAQMIRDYKRAIAIDIAFSHDDPEPEEVEEEKILGIRHVYECDERGSLHDGYLRMCATCRGIRWMPKNFFPPFINEVVCDKEKSCLYFYNYPHGKCLQKHLNFQILQNVGTDDCQIWRKYNLNVPVCCECFVDHMSFFAKYV